MEISEQEAVALIEGYRKRPADYIRDVYGDTLWHKQEEIVQDIFTYREVGVKTCNAVGKSYIAARAAHAFLDLLPGSLVVTTAPTWRQVKDVLWREFGTCHKAAKFPLGGRLSQTGFEYDTDWYAVGLSTKYPENFFGYHANYILVIVDEAGGVPEPIFKGVKAITPNVNAHVLYIGNPTDPSGTFYDIFKKPRVKKHTISAFDTPNFKHVGISDVDQLIEIMTPPPGVDPVDHMPFKDVEWPFPTLISPEVVFERVEEWGTDSPAWEALVMGEFPSQAENSLIPMHLIQQAMSGMDRRDPDSGKTYAELSGWPIPDGSDEYGLDMARFGMDKTVLTPRRGGWVQKQISWGKTATDISADKVVMLINPHQPDLNINIDDTGNGGGTTDSLLRLKRESLNTNMPFFYHVSPYNFSQAPLDPKFDDITSELYWNLRQQFLDRKIALPDDPELFAELSKRKWWLTPAGKIHVQSKDEYKKETGRKSPDKSDSLVLAFAPRSHAKWQPSDNAPQQTRYQSETQKIANSGVIGLPADYQPPEPVGTGAQPVTRSLDERY
jgi:phage terminase large subunit